MGGNSRVSFRVVDVAACFASGSRRGEDEDARERLREKDENIMKFISQSNDNFINLR